MNTTTDRVRWVMHHGKPILLISYAGLKGTKDIDAFMTTLAQAREAVCNAKEKIRFLTDTTDGSADRQMISELKAFAKECKEKDIIEKECVVGITGVKRAFVQAINLFARTTIVMKDSIEDAMAWLVE